MLIRVVLLVLLLSGCAHDLPGKVVPTQWVELDEAELQATCRARDERVRSPVRSPTINNLSKSKYVSNRKPVNGCFDWINGVCVFYTRRATSELLESDKFQETIGEEFTHCHKHFFHG